MCGQALKLPPQFDLQRDAASRGSSAAGPGVGGNRDVPLFTSAATAAASNSNKENTYRRRSSSLKEGSPLKTPLPKGSGSKRLRVSASLKEGDGEEDVEKQDEVLVRADKKKKVNSAGRGGRRMSEAESAAVIMGKRSLCCMLSAAALFQAFKFSKQVLVLQKAAAGVVGSVCEQNRFRFDYGDDDEDAVIEGAKNGIGCLGTLYIHLNSDCLGLYC